MEETSNKMNLINKYADKTIRYLHSQFPKD